MSVQTLQISRNGSCWIGHFRAMASPCEIHLEASTACEVRHLLQLAMQEALRIEAKYSRYQKGNIVFEINNSKGKTTYVDDETARMLDFAQQCYTLSNGLFDITSGILSKVWNFDGSDRVPKKSIVKDLLRSVGWHKLCWKSPALRMPADMQIDFGGIGKEYAVDRTVSILRQNSDWPFLVNYGGDLHASAPPRYRSSWCVGIEAARHTNGSAKTLQLHRGALTTSGDAQRYLYKDGIRYGHVLNPLTGWPAVDAPASVTVAGDSCIEAGVFSTLAVLKGLEAESFLEEQGITYWCQR